MAVLVVLVLVYASSCMVEVWKRSGLGLAAELLIGRMGLSAYLIDRMGWYRNIERGV